MGFIVEASLFSGSFNDNQIINTDKKWKESYSIQQDQGCHSPHLRIQITSVEVISKGMYPLFFRVEILFLQIIIFHWTSSLYI